MLKDQLGDSQMNLLTLLSILVLLLGVISCGFLGDIPHQTDAEMVENFRLHRADFENLLAMIRDDESKIGKRLYRIDYDWTEPKDLGALGISDERVREYRSLFPKIGVPRGFYAYGEDDVYMFVASTQGIAVSGTSKSYVWRPEPPSLLANEELQEYVRRNNLGRAYRHIEGNWYLEFEGD